MRPRPRLSIVTPCFNEAANLPVLYDRLKAALENVETDWEWIVVDDHSRDGTLESFAALARSDPRLRGVRVSRNVGSHLAFLCGLRQATGDCAVVMAADLQDPPETVAALHAEWERGAQVVWAVRSAREGESFSTRLFSRLYWGLMGRISGLESVPAQGADFFLLDRRVIDALHHFQETNVNLVTLITWMGFRQTSIIYEKQARLHGTSGWTLAKKIKLLVDSITAFTYTPLRLMSYLGFTVAVLGAAYAGHVIYNSMAGQPVQGWSSLMVTVLVLGGGQMLMLGVLGEYLWRTLEESRRRPLFLIEETVGGDPGTGLRPEAGLLQPVIPEKPSGESLGASSCAATERS